jgi:glycosyltransferase involved in cell wall biosynthesis
MKILHLATSLGGGAGIAARRIAEAQYASGMDSNLLVAKGDKPNLRDHEDLLQIGLVEKLQSKLLTIAQTRLVQNSELLVTPRSVSLISKRMEILDSVDVVHIHASYNLLNIRDIVQISEKKKVFITLHDERMFTGGCHYSLECDGYQHECKNCPQVTRIARDLPAHTLRQAVGAWGKSMNVQFISPSNWLADQARLSSLLGAANIYQASNPVPSDFFPDKEQGPGSKKSSSHQLTLGFISENLNNPYKGIEILRAALNLVGEKRQIKLRLFGTGSPGEFSRNIEVHLGKFTSGKDARRAISSCDAIIVPSTQDNSPSVVSESLMCGVPVLGSRVGGITETLLEFNQPSFSAGAAIELAAEIVKITPERFSQEILVRISAKYSYQASAEKHKSIYES